MRIAVLIIGLIAGAIMFFQSLAYYGLAGLAQEQDRQGAGAIGLFMCLLWLIACAVVIPLPRAALGLFVMAGIAGFVASSAFPDLALWGGFSLVLAVLSFFGWRGKRRADAKERLRDALLAQATQAQTATAYYAHVAATGQSQRAATPGPSPPLGSGARPCPRCGADNGPDARFCAACGAPLPPAAS